MRAERDLEIKPFTLPKVRRNYVLFIGDAMGNAYRDAARIVGPRRRDEPGSAGVTRGILRPPPRNGSDARLGLVMTDGFASLVPDSAETSKHWSHRQQAALHRSEPP